MNRKVLIFLALLSFLILASAFTTRPRSFCTSRLQDARGGGSSSLRSSVNVDDTARQMLWQMTAFYSDMVDTSTDRFYYSCLPQTGERLHQHVPIRDLAAAWDATKALLFWTDPEQERFAKRQRDANAMFQRLKAAVHSTLQEYSAFDSSVGAAGGGVFLSRNILKEAPHIAHSAIMILSSSGALRLSLFQDDIPPIDGLTQGILSMQRSDGAFRIEFGGSEDVYRGIDFYPGEAMVALMDVHELSGEMQGILDASTRQAILPAIERAFDFYSDFYQQGNVHTNYNIWQVQAFSRLFDTLRHDGNEKAPLVANYISELCLDIANSRSWKYELARGRSFYPNLETVEIACGLDALADGIRVASAEHMEYVTLLKTQAENAMNFLQWTQDQVPPDVTVGSGGLGYGGIHVREQRLDVTGHAISALTKLL